MSSNSAPNRRSFLARSAAIAAVPAVATLAGGALAEPVSADTLPDYAPIPPSALGPAVNARGYFVGPVENNLYWVTDGTYQAAFDPVDHVLESGRHGHRAGQWQGPARGGPGKEPGQYRAAPGEGGHDRQMDRQDQSRTDVLAS